MSNRKDEFKNTSSNPVNNWLEWDSNKKCLKFYDKDKKENVSVPLPFKFLVLKEFHTIKGWDDASESGITANEVKYIGSEPVTVRSFKGGEIATGMYSEIKPKVKAAGGVYYKSLYCMSEKGSLINISIKGSAVKEWGDFTQKTRNRLSDEWISIVDAKDGKKGSITFSTPVFKFDGSLTSNDGDCADELYDTLESYFSEPSARKVEAVKDANESHASGDIDDLPF